MSRTSLIFIGVAATATSLAGCGRGWSRHDSDLTPMRAVSQLQCPDHEGSLTRVSVAADGLSCTYAGPRGSEVVLKLVRAGHGDMATISELDAQMNALMPEVQAKVPPSSHGDADVNLPGLHIKTQGDHASIRMPGVSIDADDDKHHGGSKDNANAHISLGGDVVDIRARNDAAIVRVRHRGSAIRAEYQLKDDTPSPSGWRFVGYDAHGPAGGAIVVAVVKSKDTEENPLFRDAQRLVRLNTGS
jgi:hypothetical protein